MADKYIPRPLDTSSIELSEDIRELGEVLAKNNHENYCAHRMAEGWTLVRATMRKRQILRWCHMRNCLKSRRIMTA